MSSRKRDQSLPEKSAFEEWWLVGGQCFFSLPFLFTTGSNGAQSIAGIAMGFCIFPANAIQITFVHCVSGFISSVYVRVFAESLPLMDECSELNDLIA